MTALDVTGPQLALLFAAGVILAVEALAPARRRLLPFIALAGLVMSAAWTLSWVAREDLPREAFDGTLVLDDFAVFFYFLFAAVAAAVVVASIEWVDREGRGEAEYYALILVTTTGLMLLSSARDLISIFVALELSSIPQYVLAGWGKDERSSEAGLKYILIGAVASALLLYGMALLYGVTGSTALSGIAAVVASEGAGERSILVFAVVLLVAGFGFKMAVVPFQMWVPDVYQGAPTPVAAFLSVGSKAAAFAVVTRLFFEGLGADLLSDDWSMIFAVLAAASMTVGNVMAVVQTDIKRLLGYSSIAHAGTILIGLAAISTGDDAFALGASGVLFYGATYAFTNLGAFVAVIAISQRIGSDRIADYRGMWQRSPVLSLGLAFCLISLAGIPPAVGFWGKLYLFNAGVRADLGWLVIIAVLNSVVAAYYYLGIVKEMFVADTEEAEGFPTSAGLGLVLGVAVAGVLFFGILPSPLIDAARAAAAGFGVG